MTNLNLFVSRPTKLSIKTSNLLMQDLHNKDEEVYIPLDTISAIILDSPISTITHAVFRHLAEWGILLITTDERYMPSGIFLPLLTHSKSSLHIREQLKLTKKTKASLWQEIIKIKLANQAAVLEIYNKKESKLLFQLSQKVLEDDKDNKEAFGAKVYFTALFGQDFKRHDDDLVNILLDYGYSLLRAKISRSITARGLLASLGLHHNSQLNAFNLSDDLIEVFRPFVDFYIYDYLCVRDEREFDRDDRLHLLKLFALKTTYNGKKYSLENIIEGLSMNLLRVVLQKDIKLILPKLEANFLYE